MKFAPFDWIAMRNVSLPSALAAFLLVISLVLPSHAGAVASLTQADSPESSEPPQTVIEPAPAATEDTAIAERLQGIFREVDGLADVAIAVDKGVVSLSGSISDDAAADRAVAIAQRVSGVVTVETDFERDLSVETNVTPFFERINESFDEFLSALPLIAIALLVALAIAWAGRVIASFKGFWKRVTPNIFLAELVATSVRVIFIGLGLFVALDILGATAVLGAVLGGAGVIGLAVGFALRDTVDNYVSSIMLSIRQPFRANDHVLIGDQEGRVVRLTSRATILMTLDGNHLRIPNATVFKAQILNYSRNAERRFTFKLGIDADDDPASAIETGLKAINAQPFILDTPEATAEISEVGDSNIVIAFHGWIDQRQSDFNKARGAAIRVTKNILEDSGFALPEPIYRLRFDGSAGISTTEIKAQQAPAKRANEEASKDASKDMDTSREQHVEQLVESERASDSDADLLDEQQPIE